MTLTEASRDILNQLSHVIEQLEEEDFKKSIPVLNHSTIGQHTRHTLEFFLCLKQGVRTRKVNYDKRDHDPVIETDKQLCIAVMDELNSFLAGCDNNQSLSLEANYSISTDNDELIESNLHRELAYNIEHAIHHMAIIKIGLQQIAGYVDIPEHFGLAISTIKFQKRVSSANA